MSGGGPPAPDDKHRTSFAALVLLLRALAQGLLDDGRPAEARGLIDSVEALKAKTAGNLDAEEAQFLDEVLYGLHLAVVKTPAEVPDELKRPAGDAPKKPSGDVPEAKGTPEEPAGDGPKAKGTPKEPPGDAPKAKRTEKS